MTIRIDVQVPKPRRLFSLTKGKILTAVVSIGLISLICNLSVASITVSYHNLHQMEDDGTRGTPHATINTTLAEEIDETLVNKPSFIFHVGPPKTGTTTLQCGFAHLASELAEKASTYYLGKHCHGISLQTQNNETALRGHYIWREVHRLKINGDVTAALQSRMEHHLALGNHLLFSVENSAVKMAKQNDQVWKHFHSLFQNWSPHIVISYRHYFDWLPSVYFQQHIDNRKYRTWPHQGGQLRRSLHLYLMQHVEKWEMANNQFSAGSYHPSISAVRNFSNYFDHIQIFDFHQSGDMTQNFVCKMLSMASSVCEDLQTKNENASAVVKRVSRALNGEMLAEAAYSQGYFQGSEDKRGIVKAISTRLEHSKYTTTAAYRSCISQRDQTRLFNASLSFWREVGHHPVYIKRYRNTTTNVLDLKHSTLFRNAVSKNKFCEINTEKVLATDDWTSFLRNIDINSK